MADIKHTHTITVPTGPTEGDGVSYRGIVWFVAILVVTTLGCQVLMWWFQSWEDRRTKDIGGPLAPYATANVLPPAPNLIPLNTLATPEGEATNLQRFRQSEDTVLNSYGWVDQNAGVVRIPIDRAKTLVLEKGFPVRTGK